MLSESNYTGERELGTKSTNYRKRQEDKELDRFRSIRTESTYKRLWTGGRAFMRRIANSVLGRLNSYPVLQFKLGQWD